MTRDNLRDKNYFERCIENDTQRIIKFKTAIKSVIEERGTNDENVVSTYGYLFGIHIGKLEAIYSSGAPFNEVKHFFSDIIKIAEMIWSSNSEYVEMIWLLSIGNMLEIDAKEMERLKEVIKKDGVEDYLIDFLLHAYDSSWEIRTTSIDFGHPYPLIYDIINAPDKATAVTLLKDYLENEWYDGHDDMGWYDSHKREDKYLYSGYWSFESGAIAKILELDDAILQDVPYYPYDMVHYTENT